MEKSKKIISLLLALIMAFSVFSIVPFSVGAAEADSAATGETDGDYQYNILEDGTAEITRYIGSGGNVTIPSALGGYAVTRIGSFTFEGCTSLTSVTIPDSVTSIGRDAFNHCTGLTSVTIGNSVTSIGDYAFSCCEKLTSVNIPDSVTSIGERAFYNCTGLTSVDIPDSVTSIGEEAFQKCSSLTSITIPNSVTSIGDYAFDGCTGLTSIDIPDSVTSIGEYAFYRCQSLTNITIPDSVTSIGKYAFNSCKSLTNIDIPDSVTSIGGYAFFNTAWYKNQPDGLLYAGKVAFIMKGDCPAEVAIKDGTLGISAYAFYCCTELTSVDIPDSVTSIGERAFQECSSLTSVTIPDSVTSIGDYAFDGCTELTSIDISDSVTGIGVYTFRNCSSLTSVTIGNSVTRIWRNAFYRCQSLTSIDIPDSVTIIDWYAFAGCTKLTSLTIGNSVTSIGELAFDDCSLKSVTLPDSVTDIGWHALGYLGSSRRIYDFTIYGYAGTAAKTYANENYFTFIALSDKADSDTGIAASVTEDTELQVEDVTGSDSLGNIQLYGGTIQKAYDITLTKGGETVQPEHNVTVKIPCADENAKVYRVEADDSLTDMHAAYQDGYLVFTTDHFSIYIVATDAEKPELLLGDVDGDGTVTIIDATFIQRKLVSIPIPFELNDTIADTDKDGSVTIIDATYIQRWLVNLKSNDNIGKPLNK